LDGKVDLTIIDPKAAFHFNLAALRALWDESMRAQQFIPFPKFKHTTKLVLGEVVDATETSVKLQSGEEILYDILVIATGTRSPAPAKLHSYNSVGPIDRIFALLGTAQFNLRLFLFFSNASKWIEHWQFDEAYRISTDIAHAAKNSSKIAIIGGGAVGSE
jgi:NADH dehydrogenase FAD-containing subunit